MNPTALTATTGSTCSIESGSAGVSRPTAGSFSSETQLLDRLRQGQEGAFEELVSSHHRALIRMAMGYVAEREVAEEVVQDTWMTVVERLDRFERRSSLRTWIFGILIHKAKDRGVREKRHSTFSSFETADGEGDEAVDPSRFQASGDSAGTWAFPPQPWDDQTPEKLLANQQAVSAMQQAIDALPPMLKDVLILRDVEGIDSKEVCALFKITESNLYVRLHRARERVRRAVEQAIG